MNKMIKQCGNYSSVVQENPTAQSFTFIKYCDVVLVNLPREEKWLDGLLDLLSTVILIPEGSLVGKKG